MLSLHPFIAPKNLLRSYVILKEMIDRNYCPCLAHLKIQQVKIDLFGKHFRSTGKAIMSSDHEQLSVIK